VELVNVVRRDTGRPISKSVNTRKKFVAIFTVQPVILFYLFLSQTHNI